MSSADFVHLTVAGWSSMSQAAEEPAVNEPTSSLIDRLSARHEAREGSLEEGDAPTAAIDAIQQPQEAGYRTIPPSAAIDEYTGDGFEKARYAKRASAATKPMVAVKPTKKPSKKAAAGSVCARGGAQKESKASKRSLKLF